MKNKSDLQYVILLLDNASPSFCYYKNEKVEPLLMPLEKVKEVLAFSKKQGLYLTILYNNDGLPAEYEKVLQDFPHIKIKPVSRGDIEDNDTCVINIPDDYSKLRRNLSWKKKLNGIIRVSINCIKELKCFLFDYIQYFKRVNLIITDIDAADECQLNEFRIELEIIKDFVSNMLFKEINTEFSMLTDRLVLTEMRNCDAGIKHITIAPDGKFYLCPGFYYDNENDSIGTIEEGVHIKNSQLLNIKNAPICRQCDCYQCKRCFYLNRKITLEINTPSHEQCVLSHHERNISGKLLKKVQREGICLDYAQIPLIDYLDPYELIE